MTTIGLIREYKQPPDHRVALSPQQCVAIRHKYPSVRILVESAPERCFTDAEYEKEGIEVTTDMQSCDILLGIKEVPVERLIPGKKYLFFSHTIKKQPYNRNLLREVLNKGIELVDYECLVWENGSRILGFGRFAGVVGAYNGVMTWGKKFGLFDLKPAYQCKNYLELKVHLQKVHLSPIKIALCGSGRVAHGALEILRFMKIREVTPAQFLRETFDEPVYVHLESEDYYARRDGKEWDKSDFYVNPEEYIGTFKPYTQVCDLLINAIFWNSREPVFFTREEMKDPLFNIKVIADITCDINGAIPSTVKETKIGDPVYGWHSLSEKVTEPYLPQTVDVMAVSNLPCELPEDASVEFGESVLKYVIPHLLSDVEDQIIERATITRGNKLTQRFLYLEDYIA